MSFVVTGQLEKKARFPTIFPDLGNLYFPHMCRFFQEFKNLNKHCNYEYFFHSKAWEDITRWQNNIL